MLRYDLLVYHKDWEVFLSDLRGKGLLHLNISDQEPEKALVNLNERLNEAKKVLGIVQRLDRRGKGALEKDAKSNQMPDGQEIITSVEREENLNRQLAQLVREQQQLEPWGKIDWALLKRLRKKGIRMRFYECPTSKYNKDWEGEFALAHAGKENNLMRFAIFFQGDDLPAIGIQESTLPGKYLKDLENQIHETRVTLAEVHQQNAMVTAWLPEIEAKVAALDQERNFCEAIQSNQELAAGKVFGISGYLPTAEQKDLDTFLQREGIAFISQNADNDPEAPVLLKNSKFAKLFEPIGSLYSLPGHFDIDLTPFFAPFFLLFFGFCLGDAGYGVVLLLAASILKRKKSLQQWHGVLTLGQFFGISTVVFGVLTGTLFGVNILNLDLGISLQDYILDNDGLLTLALGLGLAQILFGLAIRTIRAAIDKGWIYALSGIGWILLLVSIGLISQNIGPAWISWIAWASIALIIIPSKPESGWKSPLYGLLDLYNITGFVGDLLSYIRLFALGISSAILGMVVNTIALKALGIPVFGAVIFVLLLIIGHGGNLLLSTLSAFVHPLRLTFVEFYKNAGFNGGGKPFKRFSETINQTTI